MTGSPLAQQRCYTHSWREAAVRCPSCQRFFCRECATEHGGRLLCAQCLASMAATPADKGKPRVRAFIAKAGWIAAALGGLLFAWLVFFYLGLALARAPFDFHTG